MKKIMGLVIVLMFLVLSSYFGMGLVTERSIKRNIDMINQSNGLSVDIERYNRGWYTSSAVLNWRLHVPERLSTNSTGQSTTVAAQDYNVQMPITVYHGPIIFSDAGVKFGLGYARSDVVMPSEYAEKFSNLFTSQSTQPKLNLSLFVNYTNASRLHIGLPMFKLFAKQGGDQFEWDGMDSNISSSSNLRNIDGGFTIGGVSLVKNKMAVTLGQVISNYDLHQTDEGIYLGKANLTLPSLIVMDSGQKVLDVKQFAVSSSSDIESGLFSSYFNTSLNKMIIQGSSYGPASIQVSLKNLDAQVLAELNAQANKMQQGPENQRQQILLGMIPVLPKLFSKGAQFEISKLSFVVPEGNIEGDLLVSLPKGETGNPFQLLQKVAGHGSLKVPAEVLKRFMMISAKQKLLSQPPLQQAMIEQMKDTDSASAQASAPAAGDSNQVQDSQNQSKPPVTADDIQQQAVAQVSQKLSTMIQSGLLALHGTEYVIEVNLEQGQLSVNGKPFTPAMIQF